MILPVRYGRSILWNSFEFAERSAVPITRLNDNRHDIVGEPLIAPPVVLVLAAIPQKRHVKLADVVLGDMKVIVCLKDENPSLRHSRPHPARRAS